MRNQTEAVCFNNININAVETNAGVFIGNNYQYFWASHSKRNEGFGDAQGKNIVVRPFNILIDNDLIDQTLREGSRILS